jgi:hypothetical protein
MCRLFGRSSRFNKCSVRVLHSHNNFWGFGAAGQQLKPENAAAGDVPADALLRINLSVKTRLRLSRDSPHERGTAHTKKAAAVDAAAFPKRCSAGDRLVVVTAIGRAGSP